MSPPHSNSTTAAAATAPGGPATSLAARALALQRDCARAGLLARLVVEQRSSGEFIFLSCRPPAVRETAGPATAAAFGAAASAAATAAAASHRRPKRQPDEKRREKNRERRRRAAAAKTTAAATAAVVIAAATSVSQSSTTVVAAAVARAAAAKAAASKAAAAEAAAARDAAATAAAATAAAVTLRDHNSTASRDPVASNSTTPRVTTRAQKKRRLEISVGDEDAIPQIDGTASPPTSPTNSTPPPPPLSSPLLPSSPLTSPERNISYPVMIWVPPPPKPQLPAPPPPTTSPTPAAATPPLPQLTYAEVAAIRHSNFPDILPEPYEGVCDRCGMEPVYKTNYGYFCERCLRCHFYFNKNTDVFIIYD